MTKLTPQLTELVNRIARLTPLQVQEVERTVARLEAITARQQGQLEDGTALSKSLDWPHAPLHRLSEKGT